MKLEVGDLNHVYKVGPKTSYKWGEMIPINGLINWVRTPIDGVITLLVIGFSHLVFVWFLKTLRKHRVIHPSE